MTHHGTTDATAALGRGLTPDELHALVGVVGDLADDLAVRCAVAVVDADGALQAAERPSDVPARLFEEALEAARGVLVGALITQDDHPAAYAVVLTDSLTASRKGAVGVAGGPSGFAAEASRSAADALGLLG